jgi:hypothetical protein
MKTSRSLFPKALLPSSIATRRMIQEFAEHNGLVYFGFVSQRDDEHHIVRGATVSTKHTDDHYCIGTFEGYDVVFVERTDTLSSGKRHRWHIMEFDLITESDIPHTFVGSQRQENGFQELLSTKFHTLQPIVLGATAAYDEHFKRTFIIRANPSHQPTIESLITTELAAELARSFKDLIFELADQSLYIYSDKSQLSPQLLNTMLEHGRWLADNIDKNSRHNSADY